MFRTQPVVGRLSWDAEGNNWTPWVSFRNVTAAKEWARDMRKATGVHRAKFEFHYVDALWTAAGLLESRRNPEEE